VPPTRRPAQETTSKSTAGGDEVVGQEEVDSVMNLHSILKRSSVDPATVSSISIDESGKMRRVLVVSTPDRAIAISLFHPLPSVRRSLTVTDRIVSEMRTFTLLRSLRSIHAPRPLATDYQTYLTCEAVEGYPAGRAFEDGPDRADDDPQDVAWTLGRSLAAIHDVTPSTVGHLFDQSATGGWPDFVSEWVSKLEQQLPVNDPLVAEACDRLHATRFPQLSASPSLVHGDFHPWNVLYGPTGQPSVLDCEFAFCGDPAYDICLTRRWVDQFDIQSSFDAGYHSIRAFPQQWEEYTDTYNSLHALSTLVDGRALDHHGLITQARERLHEALAVESELTDSF